jgi:hypothetical protein
LPECPAQQRLVALLVQQPELLAQQQLVELLVQQPELVAQRLEPRPAASLPVVVVVGQLPAALAVVVGAALGF